MLPVPYFTAGAHFFLAKMKSEIEKGDWEMPLLATCTPDFFKF